MKKSYESPIVTNNMELAEGVYMASGDGDGDCYTVTARIHQKPETGREDYRIQVDGSHAATDGHHAGHQRLILTFNMPVNYSSSQGSLYKGDGTNKIQIDYHYHNNANDHIGLGDVVVTAESKTGLEITHAELKDIGHSCGQH